MATFGNPLYGDEADGGLETSRSGQEWMAAAESPVGVVSGSVIAQLARLDRERKDAQAEAEALRQEVDVLKQSSSPATAPIAELGSRSSGSLAATKTSEVPLEVEPTQAAAMVTMKHVVADETLSEEIRTTAQNNLESLIAAQVQSAELISKNAVAEQIADAQDRCHKSYLATMKKNQHGEIVEAREALARWLSKNRLIHHERAILEVIGQ